MAGGKLKNSPFHVERANYKYAIEHETDDCYSGTFLIDCEYFASSSRECKLWNSGRTKSCAQFHCKYLSCRNHLKEFSCLSCAYCFQNRCFAPKKPRNVFVKLSEAVYCCYFLKEKNNAETFSKIRKCCERIYYTEELDLCQKSIVAIQREIESKYGDMRITQIQGNNKKMSEQLMNLETQRDKLIDQLSFIGGRLDKVPQNITKSKKTKDEEKHR